MLDVEVKNLSGSMVTYALQVWCNAVDSVFRPCMFGTYMYFPLECLDRLKCARRSS